MSIELRNKTAIVTGASSGIGEACARAFVRKGMRVALAARNTTRLEALCAELSEQGGEVIPFTADVSRAEDCERLVHDTVSAFGGLDVLVNNAGLSMRALLEDVDLAVIRQLMEVNFFGTVYCTKFALPHLLASRGHVVGVSSIAGFRGLPARTGYSASKFAMHGFLESLRTETLKKDLHVMLVCPGFTATNIRFTSLNEKGEAQGDSPRDEGAMMTPQEVADHLVRGLEKRKRTVVLTTQGKLTVLLNKLIPGRMDRIVYNHMAKEPDSPFS